MRPVPKTLIAGFISTLHIEATRGTLAVGESYDAEASAPIRTAA
jgi:hypothetical protein